MRRPAFGIGSREEASHGLLLRGLTKQRQLCYKVVAFWRLQLIAKGLTNGSGLCYNPAVFAILVLLLVPFPKCFVHLWIHCPLRILIKS